MHTQRRGPVGWFGPLAILLLFAPAVAHAEKVPEQTALFSQLIVAARDSYRPLDAAYLGQTRSRVAQDATQLELFLGGGGAAKLNAWKQYLHWSEMLQQLSATEPDVEALRSVLLNYRRNEPGLELAVFRRLRASLVRYIDTLVLAGEFKSADDFNARLDELAEVLARYERQPHGEDAYRIGRILGWFDRAGQSSHPLVASIRSRYDHPNGRGRVSASFMNKMLSRNIDEKTDINETSMGAQTRGTAYSKGKVIVEPTNHESRGVLDIRISGKLTAPSIVSVKGPATVRSSMSAELDARKRLFIDENGLAKRPSVADCPTSIKIHGVTAERRIVRSLGCRRSEKLRPQAESESARSTERRLAKLLDEGIDEAFNEADNIFQSQLRLPMHRYGAFPEIMRFTTDLSNLFLTLKFSNATQIAAPSDPPEMDPDLDIAFVLHESLIANFGEALFGGKTLEDKQWLTFINVLTGDEPRPLWVHDRTPRWYFTFADHHPVTVQFDNGLLAIRARSKQITIDDQSVTRPMDISATFRPRISRDGPVLVRQGDLSVKYVDGDYEGDIQRDFLQQMRRKFNAVMQKELHFDGMVPPAGGSLGKLRQVTMREFDMAEGWCRIGYVLDESKFMADEPQQVR